MDGEPDRNRLTATPPGAGAGSRPAAEPPPDLPRYEFQERLGEGAVAVVYRARDRELNRTVAVKVLKETLALSEITRQRFHREAQVAGGLSHPNLVSVHDAGTDHGRMYLVMEFVKGRPLSQVLAERKTEVRALLVLLEKVAEGMAVAHEKGVVHRDLKPANIMVTPGGEPKVGDFGLAYLVGSETGLTRTGSALGTPMYMAPEQLAAGEVPITPRTDVYALGAILYEILTGRPPHLGDSLMELYGKIAHEEPVPPRRLNARTPRDVETIVLKALDKVPARRYASAREFAEDLGRFLAGEPVLAKPAGPFVRALKAARRHRTATAAGAALLAGALAVAAAAGVQAARRASQVRSLLSAAQRAEAEGRFTAARDAYGDVRRLRPGHPAAEAKFYEMDRAAAAAERRKLAAVHLEEGRRAKQDYDRLQREYHALKAEERRLAEETPPHEGPDRKRPLWAARKKLEAAKERMSVRYQDITVAFVSALGADPDNREAKEALARHYFAELGSAEAEGDRVLAFAHEKMVLHYDQGHLRPELAREGALEIDSVPTGAAAELLRYAETDELRLEARPVRDLGVCPVPRTKLEEGSYLLVLRKKGYRDVRYPVHLTRGTEHAARVNLYREEEIGAGFVYVPAGKFAAGGDREAHMALPRHAATADDFFIGRFEVTGPEYLEFLNDRGAQTAEEAWRRTPRESAHGGQYWSREGDRIAIPPGWETFPAMGLSWQDADEYAAWRTKRSAGRALYRLPRGPEWEKAGRGVDGRLFPWGNHFDWSFVKGGRSRAGKPNLEPGGAFPGDESPYGVRDLCGSVREWCQDWYEERSNQRLARGGTWAGMEDVYFRLATRGYYLPSAAGSHLGFRLVKEPPPR
jgi:serine/threonine-protein kinase